MASPLAAILPGVPVDITQALEGEFSELESRYARGDWSPASLNGGRFAEALLRYLEWKQSGAFTPLGAQLNRNGILNRVENDAALPEGLRFHVRRCADLLLDVRNKRDIAHLGTTIDVKEMDSRLVMAVSAWSLAEIVREESGLPASEVQSLVDALAVKTLPLVEEVGGDLIVTATDLSAKDRTLVALYHAFPEPVQVDDLRATVRYANVSRYKVLLKELAAPAHIHVKDGQVYLTRKGVSHIEKSIDLRLE